MIWGQSLPRWEWPRLAKANHQASVKCEEGFSSAANYIHAKAFTQKNKKCVFWWLPILLVAVATGPSIFLVAMCQARLAHCCLFPTAPPDSQYARRLIWSRSSSVTDIEFVCWSGRSRGDCCSELWWISRGTNGDSSWSFERRLKFKGSCSANKISQLWGATSGTKA